MKEKVMNGLEKFSKAMLSPLSYISAAGLILVLGALLTSTSLSAMIPVLQWTPIKLLGQLIYNCIMVIINNLSLMFCVGIAAALAHAEHQAEVVDDEQAAGCHHRPDELLYVSDRRQRHPDPAGYAGRG